MKKKNVLLVLMLSLVAVGASAQKVALRINNGISVSYLNPENRDDVYPYMFYTGGLGLDYAITKFFYMQTEVAYLRSGNYLHHNFPGHHEPLKKISYFDNVTVNTSFNIQIPIAVVKPIIGAGVYGIFAVNQGVKYPKAPEHDEKNISHYGEYRKHNVGLVANAGLLIDLKVMDFGLRYTGHIPFLKAYKSGSDARNYIHTLYFTMSARF